jgi:hypothetical protein
MDTINVPRFYECKPDQVTATQHHTICLQTKGKWWEEHLALRIGHPDEAGWFQSQSVSGYASSIKRTRHVRYGNANAFFSTHSHETTNLYQ